MSPPVQEQRRPARLTLSSFRVLIWTSSSFRTLSCSHKRLKVTCGGGGQSVLTHTRGRVCPPMRVPLTSTSLSATLTGLAASFST